MVHVLACETEPMSGLLWGDPVLGLEVCLYRLDFKIALHLRPSYRPLRRLLISFFLVLRTMDMPNVVTCLETDNPAMSVEVTSNRLGHVVEHNVLGCKVYWYEGRR